jgi:hypothetical protein
VELERAPEVFGLALVIYAVLLVGGVIGFGLSAQIAEAVRRVFRRK